MAKPTAADLAQWAGGRWHPAEPEALPVAWRQDTRALKPGEGFVALRTAQRDGHDFLSQAFEAGAVAALVQQVRPEVNLFQLKVTDPGRAWQSLAKGYRKAFAGPVVGITGSCGKTTAKELLALLLGPQTHKTEANFNNTLGVPLTLCQLSAQKHAAAVVEAGINQPGEMAALAAMIDPDWVLFTNIGDAHLELLGSREGIAAEKALLAGPRAQVVLPAQALAYPAIAALQSRARVLWPEGQATGQADCRWHWDAANCQLKLCLPEWGRQGFSLPQVSLGNAETAALCLCLAAALGVSPQAARERLGLWQPTGLRGQWRAWPGQRFYVDCYNANPTSLTDALAYFGSVAEPGQPRLFVLGEMRELGEESASLHAQVAANVPWRTGDRVVLVGPLAESYLAGLEVAAVPMSAVEFVPDGLTALPRVQAFRGNIFLKGSRACALERLLPESTEGGQC